MVRVLGEDGPAVLLLPGGGQRVADAMPDLVDGLLDGEPPCRVVLWDRPATGRVLPDAPGAIHAMLAAEGLGPVVLVGHSLGGAIAALIACVHPDDVAGLVLLDPTPVNDIGECRRIERGARLVAVAGAIPGVDRLVRTSLGDDPGGLWRAVRGLGVVSRRFDPSRLPRVPAAVVTADRDAGSPMARSHARLAFALGAPLQTWPGAEHGVHLTHADEVLAVVRDVVRRVRAG